VECEEYHGTEKGGCLKGGYIRKGAHGGKRGEKKNKQEGPDTKVEGGEGRQFNGV